jgi:cytidyltransferase-like protein
MDRIGLVARFKPVHNGHAAMLEALCEEADHVVIGLGSPNRFDRRNPFTKEESAHMIERVLSPRFKNYELVAVPDLDDGPRWRELVRATFGELSRFVTANAYVASLLEGVYRVAHPASFVPEEKKVPLDATMVRAAMAQGEGWRSLVPGSVERYLDEEGLVARFRQDFGLATLALAVSP